MKVTAAAPFLPNVIKFFPFPELLPTAGAILLEGAAAWQPHRDMEELRADPAFAYEGALLYVHVPYCDFFCHYCPLYKSLDPKDYLPPEQQRYVAALCREIVAYARHIAPERTLTAVYFGGGTPTSLPIPLLARVVACVRQEFDLASDLEFTVEGIAPHFAEAERIEALIALGVNRISFGVQSLVNQVRKRLGRGDTAEDCHAAVKVAHQAGLHHVNVDVMYGYPDQTLEIFEHDLDAVRGLGADSVDFYYYMQIMGTPYRQMIAKSRFGTTHDGIPLAAMRERLLERMSDWHQLTAECWAPATTGVPRIWSHTCGGASGAAEVVAVGPSSYGQVAGYYYYNQPTLQPWLTAIENGTLPLRGKLALRGRTLALRLLFSSILLGVLPKRFLLLLPHDIRRQVTGWKAARLLTDEGAVYRLTQEGQKHFQMLQCECVPALHAFVMMRNYMLSFPEQRALLFRRTDQLYARSITAMVKGSNPVIGVLRGASYWLLLRLPDRLLERLVGLVQRLVLWRSR